MHYIALSLNFLINSSNEFYFSIIVFVICYYSNNSGDINYDIYLQISNNYILHYFTYSFDNLLLVNIVITRFYKFYKYSVSYVIGENYYNYKH